MQKVLAPSIFREFLPLVDLKKNEAKILRKKAPYSKKPQLNPNKYLKFT